MRLPIGIVYITLLICLQPVHSARKKRFANIFNAESALQFPSLATSFSQLASLVPLVASNSGATNAIGSGLGSFLQSLLSRKFGTGTQTVAIPVPSPFPVPIKVPFPVPVPVWKPHDHGHHHHHHYDPWHSSPDYGSYDSPPPDHFHDHSDHVIAADHHHSGW